MVRVVSAARHFFPLISNLRQRLNLLSQEAQAVAPKWNAQGDFAALCDARPFRDLDHLADQVRRVPRLVLVVPLTPSATGVVQRAPEFHSMGHVVDILHDLRAEDSRFEEERFDAGCQPCQLLG